MAKAMMSDRGLRPTHVYHQGPLASTLGTGWEHSPRCVSADEARGQAEAERILAEAEPALVDPAAAIHGEYVPWTTHENWRDCRTRDMRTALAESLAAFLEEV